MELKRVFQMFDRNGDGRISLKELSDSLENLGILIPDKDLAQMIERIDMNGDGCIDVDEFGDLYESIMEYLVSSLNSLLTNSVVLLLKISELSL